MAAKRIWMARDCGYTADPKTQVLGDEFGAEGPLVVEEVFAIAKLACEHERLIVHYGVLARRAFTTPQRARKILEAAFELGMLDLVEDAGSKGVVLSLPRYTRWQVKDPSNAERQARHRDRDNATVTPQVTPSVTAEVTPNAVTPDRYVTQSNGRTVDSRQITELEGSTFAVDHRALTVIDGDTADVETDPSDLRRAG